MYQPSADLNTAFARADMYRRIRAFFAAKQVLEVDTPILSQAGATDVHLQSVSAGFAHDHTQKTGYLQTSPEFAMKRLVAAWQQPIFQIAKVFRDNESGKKHNIEFSMLEWYRPEWCLDALADELNDLLSVLFGNKLIFNRISYQQAFLDYADVEPFTATIDELEQVALLHGIESTLSQPREYLSVMASQRVTSENAGIERVDNDKVYQKIAKADTSDLMFNNPYGYTHPVHMSANMLYDNQHVAIGQVDETDESPRDQDKAAWLDLLYSHLVEPQLGRELPTLIYDFPAAQAALAKTATDADGNLVAKRFELYINGIELANAYDELTDSQIQRQRFEADNAERKKRGLPVMPVDDNLLAALEDMPECSGISVGLDRLLMVFLDTSDIAEVINFTTDSA